jgi:hypothetical protein
MKFKGLFNRPDFTDVIHVLKQIFFFIGEVGDTDSFQYSLA